MAALRDRISAAAQELFLEEGIEGFSLRKVARRAGVTAPAIYRYFHDREQLLDEVISEGLEVLARYLEPALREPTPGERLRRLMERYLDFVVEQPRYFDLAFLVPTRIVERIPEELAKHGWETFRLAVEQVSACIEAGVLRHDEPLGIAVTLWAEVHGLATLYRVGRFGQDVAAFRETARQSVERVLRGLTP